MLNFNLTRILNLRGIDKQFAFILRQGFHRTIANNLANNRVKNIKISHLEMLCRALNCTPNDLFEWKETGNDAPLSENHPLKDLKREKPAAKLSSLVREIPVDKLDRLEDFVRQLADE